MSGPNVSPLVLLPGDTERDQQELTKLEKFRREIIALEVVDDATLLLMRQYQAQAKKFIEFWENEYDPQIKSALEHLNLLRARRKRWTEPIETHLFTVARDKAAAFDQKKADLAAAERRRINDEKRRAEAQEAEDRRRADEAAAEKERLDRERKAEEEKKDRERKAEELKKQQLANISTNLKTIVREIEQSYNAGACNKKEAEALKKRAEATAENARKEVTGEAEAERKQAQADAERERLRAAQDAEAKKELAKEEEAKAAENFKPIDVVPTKVTVAGIRGGGNWRWKWKGNPLEDLEKVPRQLLYPVDILDVANFPEISKMVRETKNKELAELKAGGAIEVEFVRR
jgi:hypothetical protein